MFDWFLCLILPDQTKSWIRPKLTGSLWPIYQPQSEGTWFFVLTGCWLESGVNWIHRKAHQIRQDELTQWRASSPNMYNLGDLSSQIIMIYFVVVFFSASQRIEIISTLYRYRIKKAIVYLGLGVHSLVSLTNSLRDLYVQYLTTLIIFAE